MGDSFLERVQDYSATCVQEEWAERAALARPISAKGRRRALPQDSNQKSITDWHRTLNKNETAFSPKTKISLEYRQETLSRVSAQVDQMIRTQAMRVKSSRGHRKHLFKSLQNSEQSCSSLEVSMRKLPRSPVETNQPDLKNLRDTPRQDVNYIQSSPSSLTGQATFMTEKEQTYFPPSSSEITESLAPLHEGPHTLNRYKPLPSIKPQPPLDTNTNSSV